MTRAAAPAHRAPAGHWPIDVRFPWATVAGASLHCSACGTEGRAPLPKDPGYGAAVEAFLAKHRGCADRPDASRPVERSPGSGREHETGTTRRPSAPAASFVGRARPLKAADGGGVWVASCSHPGESYLVRDGRCSCPGFVHCGHCRHVREAQDARP